MTVDMPPFVWPSAESLVRRAERELKISPSPQATSTGTASDGADRFTGLEVRLYRYEIGCSGLDPIGYESSGRLAPAKTLFKKVSRRLMWWYVEPRWAVQREMTANLVDFSYEAINVMRSMSAEMADLQARLNEQEEIARATSLSRSIEVDE